MSASFILLEHTSRWTSAFRRELRKLPGEAAIPLCEVRSLAQCQRELEASPHAVIGVEVLPKNILETLCGISNLVTRFPQARWIALAARGLEPYEFQLREAGAIHLVFSPRTLAPIARLVRRHLSRAPEPQLTLDEAIWLNLPWQSSAANPAPRPF